MKIGAQLFSLHKFIKTKPELDETLRRLKDMGYTCVQFSGAEYNADELAELSAKHGLPVYLTHIALDRLTGELDKVVAEHDKFGCENIGIGSMPMEYHFKQRDKIDEFIAIVAPIAEELRARGKKLFYHNHDFDLYKLSSGEITLDYIAKRVPSLNLTLDTFWLQRGGVSPVDYLENYAGRAECIHLKDYLLDSAEGWKRPDQKFAPIGCGTLNWERIMATAERTGVKYAFVEQDDAVEYDDPFGQLKLSADYLIKKGYIK